MIENTASRRKRPHERQDANCVANSSLLRLRESLHRNIGLGSGFGNPPEEVARMWRDLFLKDAEFVGNFNDVVFAFEPPEGPMGAGSSSSSSSRGSSSKHSSKHSSSSSSSSRSKASSDLEIFKHIFSPAVIHDDYKGSKQSKW